MGEGRNTHAVTEEVLTILERRPPGRLLEIPAGDMPIARGAKERGWRTVGLDLFPTASFEGVLADACARLPFADEAFDALVSMEGIEHFENQAAFLRECARVLKPGGLLVLTTPNVLHLSSRLSAFWTGQRVMKRGFINEEQTLRERTGSRTYHGHAFLIDVFRLRYLMAIEGLALDELRPSRWSTGSLLLSPLIPLVWLATRIALRSGRRVRTRRGLQPVSPEVEADLARIAGSPVLLLSRKLVVTAIKGERPGE